MNVSAKHALINTLALLIPRELGGVLVCTKQIIGAESADRLKLINRFGGLQGRVILGNVVTRDENEKTWVQQASKSGTLAFHSLVWERQIRGKWRRHWKLTSSQLRKLGFLWVADIHSFDPGSAVALIKVAEAVESRELSSVPPLLKAAIQQRLVQGARVHITQYSWIRWDLINGREIGARSKCAFPDSPYEG